MAEYIERETVLEALREMGNEFIMHSMVGCAYRTTVCMEKIESLPAIDLGATVQEWVSVKDRLPENTTDKVIVHCKNGYIGFGHYEDCNSWLIGCKLENIKPHVVCDVYGIDGGYKVTHWMPLPEPPKGE